ncbi:uncharacterized protein LOC119592942 [Penaeus monodon]|uniref:uncharacterized protein LOC119592942 n=1 Tax=Penaeus monodon TaxID=6687 RepID=UPI0018A6DE56|nr:uncharacterized protein LOC119592942 [Penaeus monodon]
MGGHYWCKGAHAGIQTSIYCVKMVGGGGGPGAWAAGGGLAVTFMAVGGAVGAILLVVVGVWAARRWAGRKNSEERQQILLWPGAGAQPCSFQTREIRFTLPPSMAPLAAAASEHENQPDGGGDGPAPHSGVTSLSGFISLKTLTRTYGNIKEADYLFKFLSQYEYSKKSQHPSENSSIA